MQRIKYKGNAYVLDRRATTEYHKRRMAGMPLLHQYESTLGILKSDLSEAEEVFRFFEAKLAYSDDPVVQKAMQRAMNAMLQASDALEKVYETAAKFKDFSPMAKNHL